MNPEANRVWTSMFTLSPVLLGLVLALINASSVNERLGRLYAWVHRQQEAVRSKSGLLARYYARPVLWLFATIGRWTETITHDGLRSGTRFAATLYVLAGVVYLSFVASIILIFLAFLWIVLLVIGLMSQSTGRSEPDERRAARIRAHSATAKRREGIAEIITLSSSNREKLENYFHLEDVLHTKLDVDDQGVIWKAPEGLNPRERIGEIDAEGNLYDTRSVPYKEHIGRIDSLGNVRIDHA